MSKPDKEFQLNKQRAKAAVLCDAYRIPLTNLHDLTHDQHLRTEASRELHSFAPNILASLFAIAYGHPLFLPAAGHGGHGGPLGNSFLNGKARSPAACLEFLIDEDGCFEDLVTVYHQEYKTYGLDTLLTLVKDIPKLLQGYIPPALELQEDKMIHASNIICLDTFNSAYKQSRSKKVNPFGGNVIAFFAEKGPLGLVKRATTDRMSTLLEKKQIKTLEDVKKHKPTDPKTSRTLRVLKRIGADADAKLYFNIGIRNIDELDTDKFSNETAKKIIEIIEKNTPLIVVLGKIVSEYMATSVPDMSKVTTPTITFG